MTARQRRQRKDRRGFAAAGAALVVLLVLLVACDADESDLEHWASEVCSVAQDFEDAVVEAAGDDLDLGARNSFTMLETRAISALAQAARDGELALFELEAPPETQAYTDALLNQFAALGNVYGRLATQRATDASSEELDETTLAALRTVQTTEALVASEFEALSAFAASELAKEERCGALTSSPGT